MSDNYMNIRVEDNTPHIDVSIGTHEIHTQMSDKKTPINVTVQGSGPRGLKGDRGDTGLSSYELWLSQGNIGTLEEFLSSLGSVSTNAVTETDERMFMSAVDKARSTGYVHRQIVASATWTIDHPLEKFPSVSVVDTGGNLIGCDIEYVSNGRLILKASSEFSGDAYLN